MVYAISTWEAWSRFHSENILDGVKGGERLIDAPSSMSIVFDCCPFH